MQGEAACGAALLTRREIPGAARSVVTRWTYAGCVGARIRAHTGQSITADCDIRRSIGTQARAAYRCSLLSQTVTLLLQLHAGKRVPAFTERTCCALTGLLKPEAPGEGLGEQWLDKCTSAYQ